MTRATPSTDPAPSKAERWRRLLYRAIVVEIAAVTLFLIVLLIGETSRFTLLSLYFPRQPLLVVGIGAALAPLTKHRRARALSAIQLGLFLVVLFPVMGMTIGSSRHVERPIRLATYNVFFGRAGRPELVDEIVAMKRDADVIVLQAAFGSLGDKLRERMPDPKIAIHQEGEFVLITSLRLRSTDVPSPLADGEEAMFVKYVLETPSGAVFRLVNVHPFSPRHALMGDAESGDNIADREAQIAAAVTAARSDVPPFLVAGDTNLPVMSAIGRRQFAGLTDAFGDVGFGFGFTFPAKRPWMRIDRIVAGDGARFASVRVGKRGASDHLPLFVEFEVTQ